MIFLSPLHLSDSLSWLKKKKVDYKTFPVKVISDIQLLIKLNQLVKYPLLLIALLHVVRIYQCGICTLLK